MGHSTIEMTMRYAHLSPEVRKDAVALNWMAKFTRDPLPEKIVWKQSGVTHRSFYWLAVPKDQMKRGAKIVAQSSPSINLISISISS